MKKKISRILAGLLALLVVSSCGNTGAAPTSPADSGEAPASSTTEAATDSGGAEAAGVSKTGFPIVDEPIILTGLVSKYELVTDWNEHKGLKNYEEQTNMIIQWDCVPDNSFDERRNLLFASRDLPDFVVRANLKPEQEASYVAAGQIIAFDDIMDYAPNISALMEEDPGIRKAITAADGHIYSLPSISEADGRIASSWINQSYLDNLGLPMPTTMDEFYETIKAFRDQDANGNGVQDEVGISGYHSTNANDNDVNRFFRLFYGSWGFGKNSGIITDFMDVDDGGQIRFIAADDNFKDMVEFFRKMWEEDLIDKEIFSQDRNQVVAKMDDKRVGYVAEGNNFLWMGDNAEDFVQNPVFSSAAESSPVWVGVDPKVRNTGCFVITSVNEHPEATLRWADHFFSLEGTAFCRLGVEGVTYYLDDDGFYKLYDEYGSNPDLTVDEALSDYSLFQGGRMLMRVVPQVDQSAAVLPAMIANKDVVRPYLVPDEKLFKNPSFTDQEVIDLSAYATDINAYTSEQVIKFLTGAQSMDEWDSYVSNLNSMGLDKYLEIYQAAYDRWNA